VLRTWPDLVGKGKTLRGTSLPWPDRGRGKNAWALGVGTIMKQSGVGGGADKNANNLDNVLGGGEKWGGMQSGTKAGFKERLPGGCAGKQGSRF